MKKVAKEKVELVEYDPSWPEKFQREKQKIEEEIGKYVLAIEHIGSTAIPFMIAKPVIDIQIGVKTLRDAVHSQTRETRIQVSARNRKPGTKKTIVQKTSRRKEKIPDTHVEIPNRRVGDLSTF